MNRLPATQNLPVDIPGDCEAIALNFELPSDGSLPQMIELVPGGPEIIGRDGRRWRNDEPQQIVDALSARAIDLVVDFEHATELKAPRGEQAPAAAWITDFELKADGSVWGQVFWTPKGAAAVSMREYRYLSPVLLYHKQSRQIRSLSSLALTNKPNLFNKALNHQQTTDNQQSTSNQQTQPEEDIMLKTLLAKLGLPEDATDEQALQAIEALQADLQTANNRAETPSLDKFVPRADYDAALARAANAEQALDGRDSAEVESAILVEIDAALKAGKIVPATRAYYSAMCHQQGGLAQFKAFVAAAPVVGDAAQFDRDQLTGHALNAEQEQIADLFGNSAEDLVTYGQH
ncbi:MAG: phage protease [Desulfuromonadales bacterium]|nr:phage protease [Desulfuromonadales bacterium]